MASDWAELAYYIRIGPISENKAQEIKRKYSSEYITSHKKRDNSGFTISVKIIDGVNYCFLKEMLNTMQIERDNYDLFVSVITESDTEIIEIPEYVERVAKLIAAQYVFSFTVV